MHLGTNVVHMLLVRRMLRYHHKAAERMVPPCIQRAMQPYTVLGCEVCPFSQLSTQLLHSQGSLRQSHDVIWPTSSMLATPDARRAMPTCAAAMCEE
jgi:hypothetical protein